MTMFGLFFRTAVLFLNYILFCVKDSSVKPTVRYERGLVVYSLTIFTQYVTYYKFCFLKWARPNHLQNYGVLCSYKRINY